MKQLIELLLWDLGKKKNDNNTKKKICDIRTKQKNPER
jgi:hypothetical protein